MNLDPVILDRAIEKIEKIYQKMKQEVKIAYKGAKFRCLKSLSFPEMGARQANIERPATNTCNWIYKHPTFRAWESQFNTLLWIKGKLGSGKSTLMKSLYQKRKEDGERQKTVGDPKSIHLSFFFNARGAAVKRTPIGLYITLLHGVLQHIPLVMCEFLPIFTAKEFHSQNGKIIWQTTEVADAFHSIIEQKQANYIEIVVDVLDECEDEEVRLAVRKFESSIINAAAARAKLRVCWSSRYYPHISLKSKNGFELQLDKQNDLDIRQYVRGEFHTGIGSSIVSIKEDVISRANRVFLWAVLVTRKLLKAIDRGEDEKELRTLLNSIPPKLDDLFDEIFKNANASAMKRQELVCMAQWIFCAFRPLTINEFLTATSFQTANISPSYHSIEFSRDAKDRLKRRITDISGGLFEVTGSEGLSRVQVIHESVREFFLGLKG